MKHTNIAHKRPEFSPSYDNKIFKKFGIRTMEAKIENKLKFQEELGWVQERRTPLLCISTGMTDALGGEEFNELIEGIISLPCQLVVRGIGSEKYGKVFTKLENNHSHRVKIIKNEDELRRKMYAASDIGLFFVPEESELANCMAYGVAPISPEHSMLMDYNPIQEAGNAFIAHPHTSWTWFAALVRAVETFKLPYDWRTIQKHCIESMKGE